VFVPLPGPDTATARAIAARYGGSSPESGVAGQARPGNAAAGGAGRASGTGPASDAGQ
jgi:hypothetical protein